MRVFVFIVLIVSSLVGCKTSQPTIETKTIVDTAFIEIENKQALLDYIQCDSNFQALWLENIDLQSKLIWNDVKFDSSKNPVKIPAKIIIKKVVHHQTDTVFVQKPHIIKEKVTVTPAWAYWMLGIATLFMISTILLIFLGIKLAGKK